jgi:hypothetical protein
MSDSVLAAIIAGSATLSASFLQLRTASLKDAARGQSAVAARRKSRLQRLVLLVIVGAAGASGFALSQWLTDGERRHSDAVLRELQTRIEEISHTTSELELTREGARSEIQTAVLRGLGTEGVAVAATVAACRPGPPAALVAPAATAPAAPLAVAPSAAPAAGTTAAAPSAPRACTETDATPVTLCASIPAGAKVTEVALFSRLADTDTPWSASRYLPGQESGQARFADKYAEGTPDSGSRQVCQAFANWSVEHARMVRVLVRYSL